MRCKDLKVVNLNITEDEYRYNALFRLCTEEACIETDVADISNGTRLQEIKDSFGIEESCEEIKEILMQKIVEISAAESRNLEGETCCPEVEDEGIQKSIGSLSMS
jgi:hypothetical protein